MGWQITLEDGTVLKVGKLPRAFFRERAALEGVPYWEVYIEHPAANMDRFDAILEACCERQGVELPTFDDMDEWVKFTNEQVSADVPIEDKPMVDGFPQTPGEPESGSTSTSPGDMDGPQTS